MKSIFRSKGFDSIIGAGTTVSGNLYIEGAMQVDGTLNCVDVMGHDGSLHLNGKADVVQLQVKDLTVCGVLKVKDLIVIGTLAVKKGATLDAGQISYTTLVIEPGALISGNLQQLKVEDAKDVVKVV